MSDFLKLSGSGSSSNFFLKYKAKKYRKISGPNVTSAGYIVSQYFIPKPTERTTAQKLKYATAHIVKPAKAAERNSFPSGLVYRTPTAITINKDVIMVTAT